MQSFEVEILNAKAANILYDLESMKLIRLKERVVTAKTGNKKPSKGLASQIETGLKDVAMIRSGKVKPRSLRDIIHGK